jgi:hypothetical protein
VPKVVPVDHSHARIFAEALGKLASSGSLTRMLGAPSRKVSSR